VRGARLADWSEIAIRDGGHSARPHEIKGMQDSNVGRTSHLGGTTISSFDAQYPQKSSERAGRRERSTISS